MSARHRQAKKRRAEMLGERLELEARLAAYELVYDDLPMRGHHDGMARTCVLTEIAALRAQIHAVDERLAAWELPP